MILKRFYLNIVLRIILISINVFIIVLVFDNPKHLFSIVISVAFFLLQIILLIKYLNKINRNLANFLGSVLYKDGTFHLPESKDVKSKDELSYMLNSIGKDNQDGNIDLVNNATINLFRLSKLKTIYELDKFYKDFSKILIDLIPQIPKLINVQIANEEYSLSVRASVFKLDSKDLRLVSFHVINEEMNEIEIKSWEKLIRVLTHEIMNSVSPISSLTTTITRIFKPENKKKAVEDLIEADIDDTISGLDIINSRSLGLIDFIKKYRKVHLMPKPVFEDFEISNVLVGIKRLLHNEIDENKIDCDIEVYPKNLTIYADKAMIEQVIINLFKNAIEAEVDIDEKAIKIKAFRDVKNNPVVEIADNGKGVSEDIKDDIFVPFFTTKKTGSGIGLSLVKQLVFLNKAKLNMRSEPNKGTTFTLMFNK